MLKIIAYPLSVIYFVFFGLTLIVFHPIQWICVYIFGYEAHKRSVSILNWCLMRCTHILGTRYTFTNKHSIPENVPLIVAVNHQSMNDIPPLIWFLRKYHPKFVAKKELAKGVPSVSFNLRHGGSVAIDRKDAKQALSQITKLGQYIEKNKRSAVIFPEGSRSRDGKPKPFKSTGLKVLMQNAPSAIIVPISINNSWKLLRYGKFPMGLGNHITFEVHPPLKNSGDFDQLVAQTEALIKKGIKQ